LSSFPVAEDFPAAETAEEEIRFIQGLISEIRNLRGEMNIPPAKTVEVHLRVLGGEQKERVERHKTSILTLARGSEIQFLGTGKNPASSVTGVFEGMEIFIPLKGVIQFEEEKRRLEKELDKVRKERTQIDKKLSNEDFLKKAPAEVVDKEKEKLKALAEKAEKLEGHLERIKGLMQG
jgi:valyl-tRNA synthetase